MTLEKTKSGSDELEPFRREVRAFIEGNFSPKLIGKQNVRATLEGEAEKTKEGIHWKASMGKVGWGVPSWPKEYGGGGLSKAQVKILRQEMTKAQAWNPIGGMGVMMLGPTLLEFANEAQKKQHIPAIARGDIRWCQGFSEPGAGSDLAGLKAKCEDMGDHYLVNGQKTWTSGGQWADWCFAIVRTDNSHKHEGISFLLIDMKSPGVEVRPIQLISGRSPFCETFFTDVKVPKENLVGELNQGWTIAKRLLQHERTNLSAGARMSSPSGPALSDVAKKYIGVDDRGRIADPYLRAKIIEFDMLSDSFRQTAFSVLQSAKKGAPASASSILKNVGAKLTQTRSEILVEIMGMQGLGWEGEGFSKSELEMTRGWLWGKAVSIYGGSSEIQKNIISKRILGMLDHQ